MQFISLNYILLSYSLHPSTMYCCHPLYIPQICTVVIQFISLNYVLLSSSLYPSTIYYCHPLYIPQLCTVFIQFKSLKHKQLSSNLYTFTKSFNHVCCRLIHVLFLHSFIHHSVHVIQSKFCHLDSNSFST